MSDLRELLTTIYNQHEKLTPAIVVDVARDPQHPLHHRFEWDDAVAAEKHRRDQAAQLIREVQITFGHEENGLPKKVRGFVSITRADATEYAPIESIQNEFQRKLLVQTAEREWKAFRRKYDHLVEFWTAVQRELDERDVG